LTANQNPLLCVWNVRGQLDTEDGRSTLLRNLSKGYQSDTT